MPWPDCELFHSRPDAARPPLTHQPANPTSPANSRQLGSRVPLAVSYPPSRSSQPLQAPIGAPKSACRPPISRPSTRIEARSSRL